MPNWKELKTEKNLTKEELIIVLLKSESSAAERNFEKLFNDNNTDDDTYDNKIRDKIRDTNTIFSRLGNIVTSKDRKKITKSALWNRKKEKPFR